ncbi:hypothetical protein [Deinococcus enclensis]|uniref:Uncharacterized protein n=1 Tax=Deinococcus enclensis TaxID=1049582 RepID=A0ABT9MFA4_9DEIO|nr:hypothetical protein [Deinococcus enclensis]MDP9765231.1 hypothetical protein [Deinococcus enclensis]
MTKHLYDATTATGEAVTVDTGWERGRQCFFLTVFAGEDVRYDSDTDARSFPHGMRLPDVTTVLGGLGLALPETVRAALTQDEAANAAPYIRHHPAA